MHHAADVPAVPVHIEVRIHIGGRLQISFNHVAFKIDYDHVRWSHHLIAKPAGFDHDHVRLGIATTHVPAGPSDKSLTGQFLVKPTYLFLQGIQHIGQSLCRISPD
jgi:hypothetical protein